MLCCHFAFMNKCLDTKSLLTVVTAVINILLPTKDRPPNFDLPLNCFQLDLHNLKQSMNCTKCSGYNLLVHTDKNLDN